MLTLRPYQQEAIETARRMIAQRKRRLILVSPTGSGKTVVASGIIQSAVSKGNKVLFLAHRKELIDQASEKLDTFGIPHGVIMAKHWRFDPSQAVQVASIQTWRSWVARAQKEQKAAQISAYASSSWQDIPWKNLPRDIASLLFSQIFRPDLIVIDEAHLSIAKSYADLVAANPQTVVLGLTATPARGDGRALGDLYHDMVPVSSVKELISLGYLVPPRHFAPSVPDLSQVQVAANGDYDEDDLSQVMDRPHLVGNLVEEWSKRARGRPTIAFAVNRQHSRNIVAAFEAAGVRARHLDGTSSKQDRESGLRDLAQGRIDLLSNVGLFTEGLDLPAVSCIVLARPTRSLALYLQMAGRGLRPSSGKSDCLVLDHAGSTLEFGLASEDREWSLDGSHRGKKSGEKKAEIQVCGSCQGAFRKGAEKCPHCGWVPEAPATFTILEDPNRELVEISEEQLQNQKRKGLLYKEQRDAQTLEQLLLLAQQRGYKPGWAQNVYAARLKKRVAGASRPSHG